MQVYDDYALNPDNFEIMAREYKKNQAQVVGLNVKKCEIDPDDVKMLFKKIEYLRVLVDNLKNHTSNIDALRVIDDITTDISEETKLLANLLKSGAITFERDEENIKIFCNNLKLSINTAGEIVKLLVKIKDDDSSFELSPELTKSVNEFVDINNQLVSLFGECRYRGFAMYRK